MEYPWTLQGSNFPAVGGGSVLPEPEGDKGMFDLEQLVTAHLQQAGQSVLSINHQERV